MIQNILNEYKIKETIGTGTFSKVKLGIRKSTGEKVAIKILEKSKIKTKSDQARVERELNILKKINHINIIKIIQTKEDPNNIYIIMEFIDYDLFLHIVNNKRLEEKESALFFFQLITGLEYIHHMNIVHRDLKPENLLLTKKRILKIIDFGLSNYFAGGELLLTQCGSPSYTPPEMIKGDKYNGYAVDVWSSGIILYGMLCGHLPFDDKDNKALFKKIVKCKVNYPKYLSNNALNILKRILVDNPDKRITIKDIKKHPFYLEGKKYFYKKHPDLIGKLEISSSNPLIINTFDTNIITNNISRNEKQNNYNKDNKDKDIKDKDIKDKDIKDNKDYTITLTNYTASEYSENNNNNDNVNNNVNNVNNINNINNINICNINEKDKISSRFKSKILGPNFDLLKKILKGSRSNSIEKLKNSNANKNGSESNRQKKEKNEKTKKIINITKFHYSPTKLIQKIIKEKQKYLDRPQYSERREKINKYRQKILNRNIDYSYDYDNEKNFDLFNICNNFSLHANSEVKRKKDYQESLRANKIKSFISANNNRKRNTNYGCNSSFSKKLLNPRKVNTFYNYGKKKKMSLNVNLSRNNRSRNNIANIKSNNSINWKYETLPIIYDSFDNLGKNRIIKNNNNNNKKNSLTMKSYSINKSKDKSINRKVKPKIKKSKNTKIINNSSSKKKTSGNPHYSWLSKKIISVNNLYNTIQNKYDKLNNYNINTDYVDTIENIENNNISSKNRISKTEERRRKSRNDGSIMFYQSFFRNRLKSFKNMNQTNTNLNNNIKDLNRYSFNTIAVEPKINNNNNNYIDNINFLKNNRRNVIAILNKNRHRNKNHRKKIDNNNNDKYNIKKIIEKRGLNCLNRNNNNK